MKTINTFINRHPVLTFYAVVFAISWGGILMVVGGPGAIPGTAEQVEALELFAVLAYFAGPSLASILVTGLVDGWAGLRELLSRLLRWRVGARWYTVALLFAPLLVTAVLLPLSLRSPDLLPGIVATDDKAALLLMGIAGGLIGGGFLEELGWTGFAVPRLRLRYGALTTGLIVGLVWGILHLLVAFWMSGAYSGALSWAFLLSSFVFFVASLSAYRVLMVWVYDRTGSLLVAMLMHASLSASRIILNPLEPGVAFVAYDLVFAAALWATVAIVAVASRGHLTRQPPLRRRVA